MHYVKDEIPSWFLRLKETVWESLSSFIGIPVTTSMINEVEAKVNTIIKESSYPITQNGLRVNSITIEYDDKSGMVHIKLNH